MTTEEPILEQSLFMNYREAHGINLASQLQDFRMAEPERPWSCLATEILSFLAPLKNIPTKDSQEFIHGMAQVGTRLAAISLA